jgi:hypothetical protein
LHGAGLLVFSLISNGQGNDARTAATAPCLSFCVFEDGDEEVIFEGPRAPAGAASVHPREKKGAAEVGEPMTAALREPWGSGPEESEAGVAGPRVTSAGPGVPSSASATSFFQVATRGQRIVYLVDGSGSMTKNGAWKAACRELDHSVRQLSGSTRFQIIIYNHEPHYLLPTSFRKWLEATPALLDAVAAALRAKVNEGATNHELALKEAFLLDPPPDVLFLLTDADDLGPEHVRLVRSRNQHQAVVNTIELTSRHRGRPEMPLQIMARDHRGVYQAVDLDTTSGP